jgi:hypothetical protein
LEAATGFEPVIKVLQTFALPLGHAAISMEVAYNIATHRYSFKIKKGTDL